MVRIKFEIGGQHVDPSSWGNALQAMLLQAVADDIHRKVASIRHPKTGEAPVVVVRGNDIDHLSVEVRGSDELVQLVTERLGGSHGEDKPATREWSMTTTTTAPTAFLCHATEDKALARRIAADLQNAGIDTFFDEWEIRAGDSLRQRIDAGLGRCTHFIALLTLASLSKPWVNAEMDGAFVRKLDGACRFMPLRKGIAPNLLPPLLQGILSPAIDDYESDIQQLVSDIFEISRKPKTGSGPDVIKRHRQVSGLSPAAEAIASLMIERSVTGMSLDPELTPEDLRNGTGLTDDDIVDAVDELTGQGFVVRHVFVGSGAIGFDFVTPEDELFASLDQHFMDSNPEEDARRIAADMASGTDDGTNVALLATQYGWEPRRINPAVAFLVNRRLAEASQECGTHPWIYSWIRRIPATRRFARG